MGNKSFCRTLHFPAEALYLIIGFNNMMNNDTLHRFRELEDSHIFATKSQRSGFSISPNSSTNSSVEVSLSEFFAIRDSWLKSTCRDRVLGLLVQHRPVGGWKITQAILNGVGKFSTYDSSHDRRKSLLQLVAFFDMVENIQPDDRSKISKFAQDPVLTDTEIGVLNFLGCQTVHDPEAQGMCGPGTLTFSPFCPVDVELAGQCEHRWPSLNVGFVMWRIIRREETLHIEYIEASVLRSWRRGTGVHELMGSTGF